jgi:anti-anti-sigma regulatory factor
MAGKMSAAGGHRPAAWPRAASGGSVGLRCRVTARGRTVVSVRGRLGEASEQRVYEYLAEVIEQGRRPVIVKLSRASSCDAYGVRALARAACLASRADRSFRLTGPAPALMQIVRTACSGYVLLKWPLGSRMEWADPEAVTGRLARLDRPHSSASGRPLLAAGQ